MWVMCELKAQIPPTPLYRGQREGTPGHLPPLLLKIELNHKGNALELNDRSPYWIGGLWQLHWMKHESNSKQSCTHQAYWTNALVLTGDLTKHRLSTLYTSLFFHQLYLRHFCFSLTQSGFRERERAGWYISNQSISEGGTAHHLLNFYSTPQPFGSFQIVLAPRCLLGGDHWLCQMQWIHHRYTISTGDGIKNTRRVPKSSHRGQRSWEVAVERERCNSEAEKHNTQ